MPGPLINPQREVEVHEIDEARQFDESMRVVSKAKGKAPRVKVLIQVRGATRPVREMQMEMIRGVRELERREVPEDERLPLLARHLRQDGESRDWVDAAVVWEGPYDRYNTKLPEPGELDRIQRQTGADEVRVAVREV